MSLRTRALIAISLMIGFYLLSISLIFVLVWIPYAEWNYLNRLDMRIAMACLVGAFAIVVSIFPRKDVFQAPGPQITEEQHPQLFAELREIARATNQEMPRDVYLVPDVNAWVAQRGGTMGIGARRVMGLGVPLMSILNVSQFRAVIAHEFGHYYGGDTKLGPWIYQTRNAIGRTLARLQEHNSWLVLLYNGYAKMFMRFTLAISRAQEYAADRIGAQLAGVNSMAGGLKQIHRNAPFWSVYLKTEVVPVVNRNFSPPLSEGFLHWMGNPDTKKLADDCLAKELVEGKSEEYDTHPALPERIAALNEIDHVGQEDPRSAMVLLQDPGQVDCNLLLPDPDVPLRPVAWNSVCQEVWIPSWTEHAKYQSEALAHLKVSQLAQQLQSGELRQRLKNPPGMLPTTEERGQIAQGLCGCTLALVLMRQGWTAHTLPGDFYFEKDGRRLEPFVIAQDLASGATSEAKWLEICEELGLSDVELSPSLAAGTQA